MAHTTNRKRTVDHMLFHAYLHRVHARLNQFLSEDAINRISPAELAHIAGGYWNNLSPDDAAFLIIADIAEPPILGRMP